MFGRILDADGNPAEGATVRLVASSPPYTVRSDTRTDSAGRFSFSRVSGLRPLRVHVVADRDPGGVVSGADFRTGEGNVTEVTLVALAHERRTRQCGRW